MFQIPIRISVVAFCVNLSSVSFSDVFFRAFFTLIYVAIRHLPVNIEFIYGLDFPTNETFFCDIITHNTILISVKVLVNIQFNEMELLIKREIVTRDVGWFGIA